MAEFTSADSYEQFERTVKTKARFAIEDSVREFLSVVLQTAPKRLGKLKKEKILYRAQRGFAIEQRSSNIAGEDEDEEMDVKVALPPERMVPRAEFLGDGRVNPRGIPCLYLASSPSAAISEMRPWVGSAITLARFRAVSDLRLVECSLNTTRNWLVEDKEDAVWGDIGYAFSKPVTHDEPHLDYVPTQILAESFKNGGFDGIVYKSLLDERGKNLALFDVGSATLLTCCLYEIKAASLECVKNEDSPTAWPKTIKSELRRKQTLGL
jgi:RES domain-containing protein